MAVQMWDVLKPTDIAAAQRQLEERRADLLRRHAEEAAGLAAEEADLDTLERLAAAFSGKFKKAATPAAPVVEVSKKPELPPIPQPPATPRPHARPSHTEKRSVSGTNFEVFSRAVSKQAL
jgi:hypothetical protein